MTKDDKAQFSAIMTAIGTTFDKAVTPPLLDIYFSALSSLSIEQFQKAANQYIVTGRFFPKPVDFLELVKGSPDDRSQQAWILLCEAVFKIGYPRSLFIEDRALAFALEHTFGGWIQCNEQLAPLVPADPMFASLQRTFQRNFHLCDRDENLQPSQHYFPSSCEAMNRENVSRWQDREWPLNEAGEPVYTQKVGVIRGGKVSEFIATYSATTAQLTAGSKRALLGLPEEQRQLVAAQ